MLVTQGGRFAGWGLYLLKGKPVFVYNLLDLERPRIEAPQALSAGKHTVEFVFTYDGPGLGKGGTGVMKVDGAEVASGQLPHTLPFALEASETFDIGSDTGTGVDDADIHVAVPVHRKMDKLTLRTRENNRFGERGRRASNPQPPAMNDDRRPANRTPTVAPSDADQAEVGGRP